jgi:rubredoxin
MAAFAPASGWAMVAPDSCWNNAVKEASCPMCSSGPLTFPR